MHISRLLLSKRGVSHSTARVKNVKVFINPNTILKCLNQIVRTQEKIKNLFPNNLYLEITYETFFNNPYYDSIWNFLGVERCQVEAPSLIKVTPDSIKEIVENYDAITKVLRNTPYELFL